MVLSDVQKTRASLLSEREASMSTLLQAAQTIEPPLVRLSVSPARGASFLAGLRACAPLAVSVVPLMSVYGVTARALGMPFWWAQLLSVAVFAGSQLVAVQLLASGVPGVVAALTAAVMNIRHVVYSATLAPRFRHLAWPWRLLAGYLVTDETYTTLVARMKRGLEPHPQWFLAGGGLIVWLACQGGTALGGWLGQTIPASWGLDFAGILVFLALLVLQITHPAAAVTAVSAGGLSVALVSLPWRLGLLVAILGGWGAGWLYQRWRMAPAAEAKGGA